CTACHYKPAHEAGKTYSPPMESCFNCHGISHGPQGDIAAAECSACHSPSFNLRPRTHTKTWAKAPHADRAKNDTNQCMMCHDAPKDCDECHKREKVDVGPMPAVFLGTIPVDLDRPAVIVYPTQPTSMGQCMYCHPDIDDFLPGTVIFAHADHLKRNYQCTVCHPKFGHGTGTKSIRRPDMLSCYRCHGLTHASAGVVATEDCYACHPKDFELMPADHTKKFQAGDHKKRANKEPEYCAMCHKPDFCVECHMGRRKSGPGSAKVIPAAHKNVEWYSKHGKDYLQQEGACGSCHDSPSCKLCHKTVMPHPADWLKNHKPANDVDRKDCNVCHTDRSSCQNCHHDKVKRADLTRENCAPCHDEMNPKPATKIQHKGFAEHAVHFDVEEKKGRPYKCYDCHVSFGTSKAARQAEVSSAHDLRLCYDCHGELDIDSRLIAPYKGKSLCVRCHDNLGV
ncbi:MAG: cytochrome c3 family protein, partial [Actinomycetota bacterium]|nr:cytochrome c3 family protein [Actinomycetota bacterium]